MGKKHRVYQSDLLLIRIRLGRCHVARSNRQAIYHALHLAFDGDRIREDGWRERIRRFLSCPREYRHRYLRAILKAHAENRALYVAVMGGRI